MESYDPVLAGPQPGGRPCGHKWWLVPKRRRTVRLRAWIDEQSHLLPGGWTVVDREGNHSGAGAGNGSDRQSAPAPGWVPGTQQAAGCAGAGRCLSRPQQTLNWHPTWLPDGFKGALSGSGISWSAPKSAGWIT